MPADFRVDSAAATDVGKRRVVNEDGFLDRPDLGLWAIADGMGGYGGGDIASEKVIAALETLARPVSALDMRRDFERLVVQVNTELLALAGEREVEVIGATLVALLVFRSHYACLWCGDSRAYLWRDGVLTQVSRDHSQVQDLIDDGALTREQARTWAGRNVVTRALGVAEDVELDMEDGPVLSGDCFLLCSDGLTTHVDDAEIAAVLANGAPAAVCRELIALTLERGATDNVSVVVIALQEL